MTPHPGKGALYGELVSQYLALRDENPGVIILFRVGSFYEVLFEDAELVARELGLKLSERPSGGSAPPTPQCGFAHHALDTFVPRLLQRGYRVAVCEESEAGASNALRQRSVVRTLTPGTVSDPRLLREDRATYLVALTPAGERLGLAWTDIAAGEFKAGEFDIQEASAEIQRLDPAEILVATDRPVPEALLQRRTVTRLASSKDADAALRQAFPAARLHELPLARAAAGLIVGYLRGTQAGELPPLEELQQAAPGDSVRLDAATQRHLEIVETERSRERSGSLLSSIDRCLTAMGRRMLRGWLLRPLATRSKILVRQRIIAELSENVALREGLASRLAELPDIERLAGRAAAQRTTIDDLRALASAAQTLLALGHAANTARSPFLRALAAPHPALNDFVKRATTILAGEEEEHDLRPDASPALTDALQRVAEARAWRAQYLQQIRRHPELARVKLERSSTQGLFLEAPANTPVPHDWIRRGGLQKVERYTTSALEQHAIGLAEAESALAAERTALLHGLRTTAASAAAELREAAKYVAAADALLSLARVAVERGWTLPSIDEGGEIVIEAGRHPVLELEGAFQSNDARLVARGDRDQIVILTGPNMAGKSTWMRQMGLIVLLAQVGSCVPARRAQIGLVDAIYTRIGAVDDLAAGRSTFMVEMLETAAVLSGARDRSLVLLDEIGRGTSTHDGMAIAWAVIEQLARGPVRPRAVLATHYQELAALRASLSQLTLMRAAVEEHDDRVSFPHRIEAGAADRSFGIEVARLAGLPQPVLERARQVAAAIEPLSAEIVRRLSEVDTATPPAPGRPRLIRRAS